MSRWWEGRRKVSAEAAYEPTGEPSLTPRTACETAPQSACETPPMPSNLNVGGVKQVAERHARILLARLVARFPSEDLLYDQLLTEYSSMCAELGIRPRPWNTVGRYLNDLIRQYGGGGRRKPCVSWLDENGEPRSPRIYAIPTAIRSSTVVVRMAPPR
jgi:hypothetical protein